MIRLLSMPSASSIIRCLVPVLLLTLGEGFLSPRTPKSRTRVPLFQAKDKGVTISVPAEELEKSLSEEERTVVGVVRSRGPSVAYVTSILPGSRGSGRRSSSTSANSNLPPGQSLGTGSGFVVEQDGYLVTNYHVIERAYLVQNRAETIERNRDFLVGNVSKVTGLPLELLNSTAAARWMKLPRDVLPQVYVRIESTTKYEACRIVDVKPELDIAVLKIVNATTTRYSSVGFGSSSDLLVGQGLVAIGNPFGLDNTVTSGVVSALNRDYRGIAGNVIRNCIQTDAAINPGESCAGGDFMGALYYH